MKQINQTLPGTSFFIWRDNMQVCKHDKIPSSKKVEI